MPKKKEAASETPPEVVQTAEDVAEPFAAINVPPPHPGMNTFRVLKQAFREYHSGAAGLLTIATPAGQAHTAPLTVSGTVDVDRTVMTLPPAVRIDLAQGGVNVARLHAPVTAGVPGTYTVTFLANVLAAGSATATANSEVPLKTAVSSAFTMT
jgi:hypothetical protein